MFWYLRAQVLYRDLYDDAEDWRGDLWVEIGPWIVIRQNRNKIGHIEVDECIKTTDEHHKDHSKSENNRLIAFFFTVNDF